MPTIATEPIELPHNKRVTITEGFETRLETGAVVELAARSIAVEIGFGDASDNERVALQIEDL